MRKLIQLFLVVLTLVNSACKKNESEVEIQQSKLDSWVEQTINPWASSNGYIVEKTTNGVYYVPIVQGQGIKPTKEDFVLVHFSVRKLDGELLATDSMEVAKSNGIYSYHNYYEPILISLSSPTNSLICDAILKMREGGTARILTTSEKINVLTRTSKKQIELFDITLKLQKIYKTSDEYEFGLFDKAIGLYFKNPIYIDQGFAYEKIIQQPGDSIIKLNDPVEIWFMCWGLNNQLLDTNIADSAKVYGVYDDAESARYGSLFIHASTNDVNSTILQLLMKMKYSESIMSVYTSKYGLKDQGSISIPGYCPLRMYIKLASKPYYWH